MSARVTRLAVLGDPHFGTEDPPVVEALSRDLAEASPDAVILAGDLTQRARPEEFRAARAFIDALPSPVLTIPGNHDIPLFDLAARFLRPYARYREHVAAELEPTLELDGTTVLGVDATRRTRHKHGVIDDRQRAAVTRRLEAAAAQAFRVVVVHQPLAAAVAADQHNVARGAPAAIAAWTLAGADLIVGGHVHRGYTLRVGSDRGAILAQTGTAVSVRRRGTPNSYYRIELLQGPGPGRTMRLQRRDYDEAHRHFAVRDQQQACARNGGWEFVA